MRVDESIVIALFIVTIALDNVVLPAHSQPRLDCDVPLLSIKYQRSPLQIPSSNPATDFLGASPTNLGFTTLGRDIFRICCSAAAMPILKRLSDALWGYVSPRKKIDDITPHSLSSQSSIDKLRSRRSMSPASRVDSWRVSTPPSARTEKKWRSSAGQKRAREEYTPGTSRKKLKITSPETELEGDTLLDIDNDGTHSTRSNIQVGGSSDVKIARLWKDEDEADETLLDLDDAASAQSAKKSALASSDASSEYNDPDMISSNWPADVVALVTHLRNRGREPLFPSHWALDFRYLPDGLFYPSQNSNAIIKALSIREFRATKALTDLIQLGPRTRDKVKMRLHPEGLLARSVSTYLRWAFEDAGLLPWDAPDLLAIQTGHARVPVATLQAGLQAQMAALEKTWRHCIARATGMSSAASVRVPTVYGVIISHTLVGIAAYNPSYDGKEGIRTVGVFDFGLRNYDVWNSFALAILVMHIRNVVLSLRKKGMVEEREEAQKGWTSSEEDLDA